MSATEQLARAVLSVFRRQRRSGKESFMAWSRELADAMLPALSELYLQGAKQARAKPEQAENVASAARARAMLAARMINQTSGEWIQEGRDEQYVFSADRAANIALTEAAHAINEGKTVVVAEKGGKVRWKLGGKACKDCRRLANKVVKAGDEFARDSYGNPVYNPPLHPSCKCIAVREYR